MTQLSQIEGMFETIDTELGGRVLTPVRIMPPQPPRTNAVIPPSITFWRQIGEGAFNAGLPRVGSIIWIKDYIERPPEDDDEDPDLISETTFRCMQVVRTLGDTFNAIPINGSDGHVIRTVRLIHSPFLTRFLEIFTDPNPLTFHLRPMRYVHVTNPYGVREVNFRDSHVTTTWVSVVDPSAPPVEMQVWRNDLDAAETKQLPHPQTPMKTPSFAPPTPTGVAEFVSGGRSKRMSKRRTRKTKTKKRKLRKLRIKF